MIVFLGEFVITHLDFKMEIDLSKISVDELLDKIGAGMHIPGSGSTAALQAIFNAQLLLTVIKITLEPKKKEKYGQEWVQMSQLKEKIEDIYIPLLKEVFHQDYIIFDRVIKARKLRNKLRGQLEDGIPKQFIEVKSSLEVDHFLATKIVIEIANVAHNLSREGMYVFLKGFKGARGDSALAIQNSLSVMMGCLHIAELNLKQLIGYEQFEDFELEIGKLRSDYFKTSSEAFKSIKVLQSSIEKEKKLQGQIARILSKASVNDIEKTVRAFQIELYNESSSKNFDSVSNAEKAFAFLGYEIKNDLSLGAFDDYDGSIETAGTVDNVKKVVRVATKFSPPVQRYTLAHELGHAILHHKTMRTLHRDRGIDSRLEHPRRSKIEVQADRFAAFFLMPRLEMKRQFKVRFHSENLVINDDVAFHISGIGLSELKRRYNNKREISKLFASTTLYTSEPFESLNTQFKVSIEAMAIQIEELGLIDFESISY